MAILRVTQHPRDGIRSRADRIVETLAAAEMHMLVVRTGNAEISLSKMRELITEVLMLVQTLLQQRPAQSILSNDILRREEHRPVASQG